MAGGIGARTDARDAPPQPVESAHLGLERSVDWDAADEVAGWYSYTTSGLLGDLPEWHANQGVNDTGFVSWDVENLRDWPRGVWGFYPLYTMRWTNYGGSHPVNLLLTPMISAAVNPTPDSSAGNPAPAPAELRGGELRFWIAEWNSRTNNAVYSYRRAAFEVGTGGWTHSSVTITPDPEAWEVHSYVGTPHSLAEILAHPQQWGFAIVGATPGVRPTGQLGFDELRVARRLRGEDWDTASASAGWHNDGQAPAWRPEGGADESGFVVGALGLPSPALETDVRYPLWATGSGSDGALHPVNLLANNVVEIQIHAAPPTPGGAITPEKASLGGGVLSFFAGRRIDEDRQTYYRYRRRTLEIGSGNWRTNRLVLTTASNDWEAYAVDGAPPIPLREILADPQQWGFGLFGATSVQSGRLGFDRLTVIRQAHPWDQEQETADWRVGGDPTGGGRPPVWQATVGSGAPRHLVVPLAEATAWPGRATGPHFVLSTCSDRHWANLYEKRRITVSLNRTPTTAAVVAGLGGGRLTAFVGRWEAADRYAFYFLRNGLPLRVVGGWFEFQLELSTDPAGWWVLESPAEPSAIAGASPSGSVRFPLVPLLQNPQRWGFAVLEATNALTGWLGFDELDLSPPVAPSPNLVVRRGGRGIELSWRVPPGSATELQRTPGLAAPTEWTVEEVWDDDVFRPWAGWRGDAAPANGQGLAGACSGPTEAAGRFFRIWRSSDGR